ncbi:hypothetical protein EVG20_g8708 [Dentipellis fragilis]|uniref:Conidiation-specific protein 6 n=1 Tax=Dentipellis fragilis TaxID=205917 RepID=A0A4Y9Y3F4_9AGAM|nr:hypothetical protein EVG20_g8708 [Dentipellis fragilis]
MAKDAAHVARGYKATLNNPNVSQEAKERARQALADMEAKGEIGAAQEKPTRAQGKGTMHQPHMSEDAKQRGNMNLEQMED